MSKLLAVWAFVGKHKYMITIALFALLVGLLDENSLVQRMKHKREIITMNREIAKYRKEYEESTEKLNELVANPEALERVARENYRMKKPNEDIYVFED